MHTVESTCERRGTEYHLPSHRPFTFTLCECHSESQGSTWTGLTGLTRKDKLTFTLTFTYRELRVSRIPTATCMSLDCGWSPKTCHPEENHTGTGGTGSRLSLRDYVSEIYIYIYTHSKCRNTLTVMSIICQYTVRTHSFIYTLKLVYIASFVNTGIHMWVY